MLEDEKIPNIEILGRFGIIGFFGSFNKLCFSHKYTRIVYYTYALPYQKVAGFLQKKFLGGIIYACMHSLIANKADLYLSMMVRLQI